MDSRMGTVEVVTPLSAGQMIGVQKSMKKSSNSVPPFRPIPPAQERYTISKSPPRAVSGKLLQR